MSTGLGSTVGLLCLVVAGLQASGSVAPSNAKLSDARATAAAEAEAEATDPPASVSAGRYLGPAYRIYRVTAYHDCGLTAAGIPSGVGQCAAPADVPFGSIVYVPALDRRFVVTDRTHQRFRHNTVDIFLPDREECLRFGRNYLECVIYEPQSPPRYGSPILRSAVLSVLD